MCALGFAFFPSVVSAQADPLSIKTADCRHLGLFRCNQLDGDAPKAALQDVLYNAALAFLYLLTVIAFIFVIYCGAQYILSAGDQSRAQKAKTCLMYAGLGIIVAGLAGFIVNAVINVG